MNRNKLLKHLAFLMFFIFFASLIGEKLHWDYSTRWFDMVLHFLGGFWEVLFFVWFFSIKGLPLIRPALDIKDPYLKHKAIFYVVIIGFVWEVFQFYTKNYIGGAPFDLEDSLSDMFFDLVGGIIAVTFYFKNVMVNR